MAALPIALTVAQIIQLILAGGPEVIKAWLQLESLMNLGDDEKQNIRNAILASDTADDETIAHVKAWDAAHPLAN